jgi:CIC family chloride channel protein
VSALTFSGFCSTFVTICAITYVGSALNGTMALKLMLLLVVLKLFGVTVSHASGNAGGIFGPSLFLGAMLGGAIGTVAHSLLPGYTATSGAYALVGWVRSSRASYGLL